MSVGANILSRLAEIEMPAEAYRQVLKLFAEAVQQQEQSDSARLAGIAARTARYRARGGDNIPVDMRQSVYQRDGFTCVYCGSGDHLQCDHVVPVSKGGDTSLENLATACRVCNARKKDRDRKEFQRMSERVHGHVGTKTRKSAEAVSPTAPPKDNNQTPLTTPSKTPSLPSEAQVPALAEPVVAAWPKDGFSRFYAAYPRKQSKAEAEKSWVKVSRLPGLTFDAVMAGVQRLLDTDPDPHFVPHPAVWLNRRRWEDEAIPAARQRAGPPPKTSNLTLLLNAERTARYAPSEPEIIEPAPLFDARRVDRRGPDYEPSGGGAGELSTLCDFPVRRSAPW